MTQATFKEWWSNQPSLDYDEMLIAGEAWDYQQANITTIQQRIAELEAENQRLREALEQGEGDE